MNTQQPLVRQPVSIAAISQILLTAAPTQQPGPTIIQPPAHGIIDAFSVLMSGLTEPAGDVCSLQVGLQDGTNKVLAFAEYVADNTGGGAAVWFPPFMLIGPFSALTLPFDLGLFLTVKLLAGNFPSRGHAVVNVYYHVGR